MNIDFYDMTSVMAYIQKYTEKGPSDLSRNMKFILKTE
jgi:hypothetical protein